MQLYSVLELVIFQRCCVYHGKATTVQGCGGSSSPTTCTISFTPSTNASAPYYEVPVMCDGVKDTLRLLHSESHVELRIYSDTSIIEAFFQGGRVAMTVRMHFLCVSNMQRLIV